VRFASVYRSFQDVEAFRETVEHLRHHRRRRDSSQDQLPLLPGVGGTKDKPAAPGQTTKKPR
jgi:transcriptional repressor NrdR